MRWLIFGKTLHGVSSLVLTWSNRAFYSMDRYLRLAQHQSCGCNILQHFQYIHTSMAHCWGVQIPQVPFEIPVLLHRIQLLAVSCRLFLHTWMKWNTWMLKRKKVKFFWSAEKWEHIKILENCIWNNYWIYLCHFIFMKK